MLKVTVINKEKSLDCIKNGKEILFEKELFNAFDKYAIKAIYNGENIGYVTADPTTTAPNCKLNSEVSYDVDTNFKGTVVDLFKAKSHVSKDMYALVVEIED